MKKQGFKLISPLLCRSLLLTVALLALTVRVPADGGIVVVYQEAGPFVVTAA